MLRVWALSHWGAVTLLNLFKGAQEIESTVLLVVWAVLMQDNWDKIMQKGIGVVVEWICWSQEAVRYCVLRVMGLARYVWVGIQVSIIFMIICGDKSHLGLGSGKQEVRGVLARIIGATVIWDMVGYVNVWLCLVWVLRDGAARIGKLVQNGLESVYLKWEGMWNPLGQVRVKQRTYRLRNRQMMTRYQWWVGGEGPVLWLDKWAKIRATEQARYAVHLRSKRRSGLTLVGGGQPGVTWYRNGTLRKGRKLEKKRQKEVQESPYWSALRWLTGVDFWLFMDKHKGVYKQQVPMFSKAMLVLQLEKLGKLKMQEQAIGLQKVQVSLVIINSGGHWMLAEVDFANKSVVVMDPHGPDKALVTVAETQKVLETAKWKVKIRKMGCQASGDGNSCGYHVLQWLWQIQSISSFEADSWVPTWYDKKQWPERVLRDLGEGPQRRGQDRAMVRRGPARYRRWKRAQSKAQFEDSISQAVEKVKKRQVRKEAPQRPIRDQEVVGHGMGENSRQGGGTKRQVNKNSTTEIFSNNMNGGLTRPDKLRQLIMWLNKVEPAALLLQETHMTQQEEQRGMVQKMLNIEAPGYQIFGAGTDDEKIKGIAVILSRALVPFVRKEHVIMDEAGRYIAVPCRTLEKGQTMWLVSIYAPVNGQEKKAFYEKKIEITIR